MSDGLQGKRVALIGGRDADVVQRELTDAGATVERLSGSAAVGARWHSALYAALVVIGGEAAEDDKALQLVREFLVADKSVAAHGAGVALLLASGGVAGRVVAADASLAQMLSASAATESRDDIAVDEPVITARSSVNLEIFSRRVVQQLGSAMEERRVDEGSELSFPASDPPAVSPPYTGQAAPDRESGSRG